MKVFWPFLAIGVLAVIEFFAARAWARVYYLIGLPLLRMRLPNVRLGPDAEQRLATTADHRVSRIAFERLSESAIAFRERGNASVSFRYLPPFHGLVRYAPEEGATYVIGWANYWFLAACALMGYIFFSSSKYHRPWDLTAFFFLIFGTQVAIGVWRYRMVAKALRATSGEPSPQSLPAQ
jgi:hypothetical protein